MILTVIMVATSIMPVLAADEGHDFLNQIDITFFIAQADIDSSDEELAKINDDIWEVLEAYSYSPNLRLEDAMTNYVHQQLASLDISELSNSEVAFLANHHLRAGTFELMQNLLSDGVHIYYVTFFSPDSSHMHEEITAFSANNFYGNFFGRYGGFEFRFFDGAAFRVGTRGWAAAGQGFSWAQFGRASAEATATAAGNMSGIAGGVAGGITRSFGFIGLLSNFVSAFHLNSDIVALSHGPGIRTRLEGNLIERAVLIEDRNNSDPRNSFIVIGSVASFVGRMQLEVSFWNRVSWTSTPFLDTQLFNSQLFYVLAPNWFSTPTLFRELIRRYNMPSAPFANRYNEWIDPAQVFEMLR